LTERKAVVLFILALVPMASVMGAYTYFWGLGINGLLGNGSIWGTPGPCYNVTIIINYGKDYGYGVNQTFDKLNFTQGASVFEGLLRAIGDANVTYQYYGSLVFVRGINGVINGGSANLYWQYYVNGQYGPSASNLYYLGNNSVVEWRYESSRF
jgi:hypothetical protein